MTPYYGRDGIVIFLGNSDDVLRGLRAESFSTLVFDPPYTPTLVRVIHMLRWVTNGGKVLMLGADGCSIIRHLAGLPAEWVTMAKIAPRYEHGHAVARPLEIMKSLLALTEGPILDPYMGVGTTLVAAKELGRECTGIDIEPKYCRTAVARLEA